MSEHNCEEWCAKCYPAPREGVTEEMVTAAVEALATGWHGSWTNRVLIRDVLTAALAVSP